MPTIGKNHPDPANAPNQPARADFKRLTEQRMDGVDDPAPLAYSGATIRSALRGAKVKFKGGGAGALAE